jgi:hypothetical protein
MDRAGNILERDYESPVGDHAQPMRADAFLDEIGMICRSLGRIAPYPRGPFARFGLDFLFLLLMLLPGLCDLAFDGGAFFGR